MTIRGILLDMTYPSAIAITQNSGRRLEVILWTDEIRVSHHRSKKPWFLIGFPYAMSNKRCNRGFRCEMDFAAIHSRVWCWI